MPRGAVRSRRGLLASPGAHLSLHASPLTRWRLGISTFAVLALYAPVLASLMYDWASFPSLSHGFAVPLLAGYFLWLRRGEIGEAVVRPLWRGLPIVLAGLSLYVTGEWGGESFLGRISLPLTLLGAVLLIAGNDVTQLLRLPIGYLLFMIPLPYVTVKSVTEGARLLDATVTARVLPWLGVPVSQEGFLLHLRTVTLEVADDCSSIPAIVALLALGAAYGTIHRRSRGMRLTLLLATVPLGIASNIVRIITTAVGAHYVGPIALDNVVHMWNGTTVFLMTLGALVALDSAVRRFRGAC